MAYTNKKSAKRKHKKYRRRSKKGGVVTLVVNPVNSQATRKKKSPKTKDDDTEAIRAVANDYTKGALENALSIFSRQQQEPPINVTIHSTSRAKRQGPTPGQIKKAEQKALAKQLKEEEKAQKKIKKEQEKAQKKIKKEEEQAAKEVTRAGVDQAFSRMFGEKYKASGPKLRKRS
jgi:gas vesicle protein